MEPTNMSKRRLLRRAGLTCSAMCVAILSAPLMTLPASADAIYNSTGETFTPTLVDSLNLGLFADYALIDLGNGTTLGWNSGPENGNVLVGNGVTVSTSGGTNGGLNGNTLFYDSTTICNPGPCSTKPPGSGLQNPPTTQLVPGSTTQAALTTAQNVSNFATNLAATLIIAPQLTGNVTINGTAGLNVIDITSLQNAALSISGPSNAYFVFDVTGLVNTNADMTLSGGVTAANVLWNLTGTSGHVLQTSGGDSLVGTFLATDGGQFQFSNLVLNGELINTDGDVQLVSGSQISTANGFTPPRLRVSIPEPSTLALFAGLLLGLLGVRGLRRA